MMIALLILILVLAGNSLFLSGAGEGLSFYLIPDLDKVNEIGLGNVISSAMNQAFFTLSLGIAAMEIFGSYMSKDHTLPSESIKICALDTFVAIMAGLIIFPACFFIRCSARPRPCSDFRNTSECVRKYGRRKNLGYSVLPVYDFCVLLNNHCRV